MKENFDYLWIIEADVIIPEHALNHLYSCSMDVVAAVVPYKFQNIEYWNKQGWQLKLGDPIPFKIFEGMACTGYFEPDAEGKPTYETKTLYLKHVQDKILQGNPQHMIFNGTGCILIKRKIFESAIRWHYEKRVIRVSGFDVYFWQDVQKAGFSAVTDGFVICQHLGA